ncbi:dihydroxyacetone kinase, C-terminal domain [Aureimonas altamirensis DSM 21988]|uniref:Dihydroxyacetone kinase, C-terminal domain n=1 Tax=Aureimonas altamirensis DSM 21988 TaxID=1121026 RepID=A0ABY1IQN4_9HYPH|nr:dihydroxyacetone kinase subunit L [Aureimonas altamirensis]SHJ93109.1 dihydroxyacetone kinase, C-terminal domain [Aureimonas altamirensis DSM 21988]
MVLTSNSVHAAVDNIARALPAIEAELNRADSRLGDGDTGTMLARVVGAIQREAPADGAELGATFSAYARATAGATGSSLGTLIATAFMTAARATKGRTELPVSELGAILSSARDAMAARGGAALGDKTVLDSLDALAQAVDGHGDGPGLGAVAQAAAHDALEAFRGRPNKIGRARMFADASKGQDDPGMLAVLRIMEAIGR